MGTQNDIVTTPSPRPKGSKHWKANSTIIADGYTYYGPDGEIIGGIRFYGRGNVWLARFAGRTTEHQFKREADARDYIEFRRDLRVTIRLGDTPVERFAELLDKMCDFMNADAELVQISAADGPEVLFQK